jgi:hypothetical protein
MFTVTVIYGQLASCPCFMFTAWLNYCLKAFWTCWQCVIWPKSFLAWIYVQCLTDLWLKCFLYMFTVSECVIWPKAFWSMFYVKCVLNLWLNFNLLVHVYRVIYGKKTLLNMFYANNVTDLWLKRFLCMFTLCYMATTLLAHVLCSFCDRFTTKVFLFMFTQWFMGKNFLAHVLMFSVRLIYNQSVPIHVHVHADSVFYCKKLSCLMLTGWLIYGLKASCICWQYIIWPKAFLHMFYVYYDWFMAKMLFLHFYSAWMESS